MFDHPPGLFPLTSYPVCLQGIRALYKGATPPAVGWAAIDSLLLGSLHNYRLFLFHRGMTEISPSTGLPRLTVLGHGVAGLFAGLTRYTRGKGALCAIHLSSRHS
jgi:solute carrier family 25 carnitine/acylcarnitine transporter 20/29